MKFRLAPRPRSVNKAEAEKHVTEVHGWEHLLANLFRYFLFIRIVFELVEKTAEWQKKPRE